MRKLAIAFAASLSLATIALGFTSPAHACPAVCSPNVGGMCGRDCTEGLGAAVVGIINGISRGITRPGYGYGRPYGYRPPYGYGYGRGYRPRPMVYCVGRDAYGRVVSRTPGHCPY